MIKKTGALLLAAAMICLAGCGEKQSAAEEITQEEIREESKDASQEIEQASSELKDVEVQKNNSTVVITVPEDFLNEDMDQEESDRLAKEKGYASIKLNEDGSATYTMSESQHDEMMQGLSESIEKTLDGMTASGDYPNIEKIIANEDFTAFEVQINADEVGMDDSMAVLPLYTYGGMYNIFNGTPTENVKVRFFNALTGALISEADSANVGQN